MSVASPSAAELVRAAFPGQGFIPVKESARFIGWAYQTARHHLVHGTFPLQTIKIGKKRLVPITSLIDFYSRQLELAADAAPAEASAATPRPRGRPRKCAAQKQKGGAQ